MNLALDPPSGPTADTNTVQLSVARYAAALQAAGGRVLGATPCTRTGTPLHAALYEAPPFELQVPPLQVCRISVNLTYTVVRGALGGDEWRDYVSNSHTMFYTPPQTAARWRKDVPSRHLNVYWHPEVFANDESPAPLQFDTQTLLNVPVSGTRPLVNELIEELERNDFLAGDAAHGLAWLLLVRLARYVQGQALKSAPSPQSLMTQLTQHVHEHLSGRIRVAELAARVDLTPSRLSQLCHQETGQSPHQFVLSLRLEHACALLRDTSLQIADIAGACGFADQQHFSNVMRRLLGTTPGRYRALHQPSAEPP